MDLNRRTVLTTSAAIAATLGFGIRPEQVLAAEGGTLRVSGWRHYLARPRLVCRWRVRVGDAFATMPVLARPLLGDDGIWGWEPSEYVEMIEQTDDLHISFKLKPGFMWSDDGGELTAEDVKFSFERYIGSDWETRWPTLDHVEVTDKYSGTIVLKSPFVAIWTMTLAFDSGYILPKSKVEALPDARYTTGNSRAMRPLPHDRMGAAAKDRPVEEP